MSTAYVPHGESVILAAGGILLRRSASGDDEVCIVLRKKYGDWTLPKGKLEAGESLQSAAQREVREETGWDNQLSTYLGSMGYEVQGVPKVVLFWRMAATVEVGPSNPQEIIKSEWVTAQVALQRLSHDAEKEFLARVMCSAADEAYLGPVNAGYSLLDKWFHLKRARARLARECGVFGVELEFLKIRSENPDKYWALASSRHLLAAKAYEKKGEIEGGWVSLHAAQRLTVFGLNQDELINRAEILRRETKKILSWRADAILGSLVKDDQLTPDRVSFAMGLRDEYFANEYHKVWLTADQLWILLRISGIALLIFLVLIGSHSHAFSDYPASAWGLGAVVAVMIFGLLGASFSCAQSLIGDSSKRSIPERVADHNITLTRIFSGIIAGLASHSFYLSKVFTINILKDSIGTALMIAFIFGYTGEKLVARVATGMADKN